MVKSLLKEPLFHFSIIGLCIFLIHNWTKGDVDTDGSQTIVITDEDVSRLIATYRQSWNQDPDQFTISRLLEEEVKAEIHYQEALRLNLDHNDEILRRRLQQKYEFLVEDIFSLDEPTEAEVLAHYTSNQQQYMTEEKISFHQIYFSPDNRKNSKLDARNLLKNIKDEDIGLLNWGQYGDSFHLSNFFATRTRLDVWSDFGKPFMENLFEADQTGWLGPADSGFGSHLIYITKIETPNLVDFADIKNKVEEDLRLAILNQKNEDYYKSLREQYVVDFDLDEYKSLIDD